MSADPGHTPLLNANNELVTAPTEGLNPTKTSITDYNAAAYASLLLIPASEEAYCLKSALGDLLFPVISKRGRQAAGPSTMQLVRTLPWHLWLTF